MPLPKKALTLLNGETKIWEKVGESGAIAKQHICPDCGVRLWSEPSSNPDIVTLRGGTLDDPSWLMPVAQHWTKSAQAWACLENTLNFEKDPEDYKPVVAAWRKRFESI